MKLLCALGCAAALALAVLTLGACSDDASGEGGQNNGGQNNGGPNDGGPDDGGPNDGGDQNNDTCQPTTTFLEVYQPNVYLLVDRSQSMEGEPMTQAKAGLDAIADNLAGRIRLGAGAYPFPSAGCGVNDMVSMGTNTPADLKDAWASLSAAGGTPTGQAIFEVRDRGLLSETGDSNDEKRQKALVLITDGDPTVCEDEYPHLEQAETLAAEGTPVFVVGFRSEANPDKLDALAQAGGTDAPGPDSFYTANSTDELTDAVRDISTNVIGCTHIINAGPPSADLLSIEIDGQAIPQDAQNGFSYDATTSELTIHGSYCETLQNSAADGIVLAVTINCPDCTSAGETCGGDSECCSGTCIDGTCGQLCQPLNGECRDDGDCCGNATCASGDELIGSCVGG